MNNMDAQSKDLDSFYQETDEKHLIPLWKVTAKLLPPEPQTKVLPYLWHWADLRRMAYRAGELVPIERGGDFFVVPPWAWHKFVNGSKDELILFSVQDTPVMQALGLYREEAYKDNGGHQQITEKFEN